jgi:hypothetical protein
MVFTRLPRRSGQSATPDGIEFLCFGIRCAGWQADEELSLPTEKAEGKRENADF